MPGPTEKIGAYDDHAEGRRDLDDDPVITELRNLYDGVVHEPLPDNLTELLQKLDEIERNR